MNVIRLPLLVPSFALAELRRLQRPQASSGSARATLLTISDTAATLICSLLHAAGLPHTAGMRLGTHDDTGALDMSLATHPLAHDVVLHQDAASLYLSPKAAQRLANQTLHATLLPQSCFYTNSSPRDADR